MEANVYSGDPNRVRDRSKDYDVTVDGVVVAVIYGDTNPPQVVWRVYGPQDAQMAVKVADAIGTAARAALAGVKPEDKAPPVAAPVKKRNYTHAIREEIAAGKSDDEIWAFLQPELELRSDQRYRIKEVRKELEKSAASSAELTSTLGKLMDVPAPSIRPADPPVGEEDPYLKGIMDRGAKPGQPLNAVGGAENVGKTMAPNLEALLNS